MASRTRSSSKGGSSYSSSGGGGSTKRQRTDHAGDSGDSGGAGAEQYTVALYGGGAATDTRWQTMARFMREGQFIDARIKTPDGPSIGVHRVVLAASSPGLASLFASGTDISDAAPAVTMDLGASPPVVGIPTYEIMAPMSPSVLEKVVEAAYTGEVKVSGSDALELLTAADFVAFDALRSACCRFIESNLNADSCLRVACVALGTHPQCLELQEAAVTCARRHFSKVAVQPEFANMSLDMVLKITSDDDVRVRSEDVVFRAVKKWMEHAPVMRKTPAVVFQLLSGAVRL